MSAGITSKPVLTDKLDPKLGSKLVEQLAADNRRALERKAARKRQRDGDTQPPEDDAPPR